MDFEKRLNENPEQKERYERFTAEEKQQLAEAVKKVERIVYIPNTAITTPAIWLMVSI